MRARMWKYSLLLCWLVLSLLTTTPTWAATGDEPARKLSPQGLDNLAAFTRLLGYVRFFHPSDQAAGADWGRVAIVGVERIEDAGSPAELASSLQDFFQPLAPTLRVYLDGNRPAVPSELFPPATPDLTYWRHVGFQTPLSFPGTYTSTRQTVAGSPVPSSGLPLPSAPLEVSLGRSVRALVPLVLYKNAQSTIPATSALPPAPDKPAGWTPSGNDRDTRLADVVLGWSFLQHSYPYFDVVQADWPAELDRALRSAAEDVGEREFVETLRVLMAALDDGHARVTHPSWDLNYQLPLTWTWLDGQLVVTYAIPGAGTGLEPGDIVLSLDGRPAQQVYRQELALAPGATPQHLRWRTEQAMLQGPRNEAVRLRVLKHHGGVQEVTVRRTYFGGGPGGDPLVEPRPENFAEIRPGILYVDFNRLTEYDAYYNEPLLNQLAAARGIVFDMRGYPWEVAYDYLDFLASMDMEPAQFERPLIFKPDGQGWSWLRTSFVLPPYEPHFGGRFAFITDGRAVSAAESFMGIVENYHLGEIVGEATAGTNGAVNYIPLPGGYTLRYTGMRVTKHDSSRHHGVGIHPTVPFARTYEGIAAGRDELLEKALEVISQ